MGFRIADAGAIATVTRRDGCPGSERTRAGGGGVWIIGIPAGKTRLLLERFRIEEHPSNACAVWKEMGSPQQPSSEQYARLESAGRLELLESPQWIDVTKGPVRVEFSLPRQGLSLLRLSW